MEEYELKIKDLLKFYKERNTEIKFRHLGNQSLQIKGRIKELKYIFTKPYVVIDDIKIFFEDIDVDTIMPLNQKLESPIEDRLRLSIPPKLRWEVLTRDNFTCRYCNRNDVQLEIDHTIPISKGGKTEIDNLVTSCFDCNRGKGNS